MKSNPYIEQEQDIMDRLAEVVKLFNKLPDTHPCHNKDFVDGIHKCQDVIIHKIVQRDYPDTFPSYTSANMELPK